MCTSVYQMMISVVCYGMIVVSLTIHTTCNAQAQTELDAVMEETSRQAGNSLNLALSPYTVWSLLTIIAEGARGNTVKQLEQTLNIPPANNRDVFRKNYKSFTKYLSQINDVQMDISSAIFTTKEQNLSRPFQMLTKTYYGAEIMPVDFSNLVKSAQLINSYIASATNNRIMNFVSLDDVNDAQILMASTLFFKGKWTKPFNRSSTFPDTFYDETGAPAGRVQMMYREDSFPFSIVEDIRAHAIELPYGKGDRISMVIILPRKGEKIANILQQLSRTPFERILDTLDRSKEAYDDDMKVYLPRFVIESDFILNAVLDKLGIKDLFNQDAADLLGIFPHYLYVSRLIQQAKIEVNEEGTEASAAAVASIPYKSPPPKFYANRPFAYFIVDKQLRTIVFEGVVSNPSTICDNCAKKQLI